MESHTLSINDGNDVSKHSELDLIPTKITAVAPDPILFVTPEKRTLLKLKKSHIDQPLKFKSQETPSHLVTSDPDLLITPEKPHTFLKSNLRDADKSELTKVVPKNKVRFNVPDSSDDTTAESLSPDHPSSYNESSSLSMASEETPSHMTDDTSDFSRRAGLYTQRNPLADITVGSNQNFDSSCSTGTSSDGFSANSTQFSSTVDSSDFQASFSKILDMKGKRIIQKDPRKAIIEPTKPDIKTPITIAGRSRGHREKTSTQMKIDKLTVATRNNSVKNALIDDEGKKPVTFLKKKSGLQRHQHSIKYINKAEQNKIPSNKLEEAQYNSSVVIGQKLQAINEQEFDTNKALAERLETDLDLKNHVLTKASEGTNIDPDECLYKNLISVGVPLCDVVQVPEFRRIKRPPPPKIPQTDEPNIMDAFPDDLIQERLTLDSRCYNLPSMESTLAPLDAVMSLYSRSLGWNSF